MSRCWCPCGRPTRRDASRGGPCGRPTRRDASRGGPCGRPVCFFEIPKNMSAFGPAPAQRAVQLNRGNQVLPLNLYENQLGPEEIALDVQHLEVARHAALVASLCQLEGAPQRAHLGFLRRQLVTAQPYAGKGVARFAERAEHRLLVAQPGLVGPRPRRPLLVLEPAAG